MIQSMSHFHQNKLKRKMSHLTLVTEVSAVDPEVGESDMEESSDEQRPLLRENETGCSTSSSQREDAKVTTNYSLIPDASLPAQVKRHDAARRQLILEPVWNISNIVLL